MRDNSVTFRKSLRIIVCFFFYRAHLIQISWQHKLLSLARVSLIDTTHTNYRFYFFSAQKNEQRDQIDQRTSELKTASEKAATTGKRWLDVTYIRCTLWLIALNSHVCSKILLRYFFAKIHRVLMFEVFTTSLSALIKTNKCLPCAHDVLIAIDNFSFHK